MKRFTEYLSEDFDPAIYNSDGSISIDDPSVIEAINNNLEAATSCTFRTPYNGLEEVRKILAYYKIFLPKSMFLDQNHGNDVFEISQFGNKMGMNNDGEVVSNDSSSLFVYFEWSMTEKGMYDIFASVVDQDELNEILSDYEAEVADDETDIQEEMSAAHASKIMYKVKNAMMSDEHKALVKSYMAKVVSEQAMPDLKKKMAAEMGSKKVSLAKRLVKEDDMDLFDDDKPKKKKPSKQAHTYRDVKSGKEIVHSGKPPAGFKRVRDVKEENEPFDPPFKKVQRTEKKDASRAKQLAKMAEKRAKAKAKKK